MNINFIKYNTYSKEEYYINYLKELNKVSEILNSDRTIINLKSNNIIDIKINKKNKTKIIKYYN
jgi:hypothetical protein